MHVRDPNEVSAHCLFYAMSFANHACISNCDRLIVGDVAFLTTTTDVPAGAELTVSYWSSLWPLSLRTSNADEYFTECHCSLCKYQNDEQQKMRTARLFNEKITTERYITVPRMVAMLNSVQKIFGFQLNVDALQYPRTRHSRAERPLSGDPSQEQLLSYISSTAEMYELLVHNHADIRQYANAAKFRAEFYVIVDIAKAAPTLVFEWAFEVATLCMLDRTGEIKSETTAAWLNEARLKLKKMYLQDDDVWDVLVAPILRDIKRFAKRK
jgi:SET domain